MTPENQPIGPIPAAVGMAFMEQADPEQDSDSEEGAGGVNGKQPPQSPPQSQQTTRLPYEPRRKKTAPARTAPQPFTAVASSSTDQPTSSSSAASSPTTPSRPSSFRTHSRQSSLASTDAAFSGKEEIRTAHGNLNDRLAPFWSSVLPGRRVLFDIYATPKPIRSEDTIEHSGGREADKSSPADDPVHSFQIFSDPNGHFSEVVVVPWEKLCTTPSVVSAVFDAAQKSSKAPLDGWTLNVRARLDYEVLPVAESDLSYRQRIKRAISSYGVDAVDDVPARAGASNRQATTRSMAAANQQPPAIEKLSLNTPGEPQVIEWTTIRVGSAGGVHVISDLVSHSVPIPAVDPDQDLHSSYDIGRYGQT